ncbi:MAG: hypothetical protein ABSE51_13515 [Terracidiphilus sp.]|jgi:hypothetical protein
MPNAGNGQSSNENKPSDGLYEFLEHELAFQRARKQEIFSWVSSLLVAIIGGVVTLTAAKQVTLTDAHRWILTAAILILCAFSCPWMGLHWAEYCRVRDRLSFYYNQIPVSGKDDYWRYDYTSTAAIIALTLVALFSVWSSVWWPIISCKAT